MVFLTGFCRHRRGLISLVSVMTVAILLPFPAAFAEGKMAGPDSEGAKSSVVISAGSSASEVRNVTVAIQIQQNGLHQPGDLLAEPELLKVSRTDRQGFQGRFRNVQWTGAGFEGSTVIDRLPTRELRARLQKVYGDPSQKLSDLIDGNNFRPAHYIQFEYWFVINNEIPMMVLDIDGPFGNGLVFAGDSRFVDLMPEIKRTLSSKLMDISELAEYEDHYYDINKRQWYLVRYMDGVFSNEEVVRPRNLK